MASRGQGRGRRSGGLWQKGLLLGLGGIAIVLGIHFVTAVLLLRHSVPTVPDPLWMLLFVFCGLFLLGALRPGWGGGVQAFLWYMPLLVMAGIYLAACLVLSPGGLELAASVRGLAAILGGFSCGSMVKTKRMNRRKYKQRGRK